jgi:spore coat protein CotF
MYCTADSCAETCATKTSHTANPRNRRVFEATLPISFNHELSFNLQSVNGANSLPLMA